MKFQNGTRGMGIKNLRSSNRRRNLPFSGAILNFKAPLSGIKNYFSSA